MSVRRPSLTTSAIHVGKLVRYAAARGIEPRVLCERVHLRPDELKSIERRIPLQAYADLLAYLARTFDDPGLPVHVAQGMRLEELHVMGFVIATSKSGREALERLTRYAVLLSDNASWQLDDPSGPNEATIHATAASTFSLGERLAAELSLCSCLHCFRESSTPSLTPTRVTFRHPAPRDVSAHERFFGTTIEFGAPTDSFSFDRALLAKTPRGADAALSAFFVNHAEELRRRTRAATALPDRVRDAIALEMNAGEPTTDTIARRLGTSERSLRRHLAAEGVSFRDLLDEVRRESAEQLLREGKIAIPDVAFLLGFSDVSTFTRAFKRWCGIPPGKYRERATAQRDGSSRSSPSSPPPG
ncbi:AraC family transcriptional regulator [Chondromyces crocatus]|uniref:AraC family transcriptional regulator n=1 Tax=Chondromyces crocatus TaxID=52 RepID=A0A0K1ED63_CHOCO|nr:AraC family transcriptional regulator [Chondromyces crocatus]AKT38617.1 AraC family transcriptional regulator [Chondromyces crocatus]